MPLCRSFRPAFSLILVARQSISNWDLVSCLLFGRYYGVSVPSITSEFAGCFAEFEFSSHGGFSSLVAMLSQIFILNPPEQI
jgi:hypothetical protein